MTFTCALFGHKVGGGYYKHEGGEYFDVQLGATDGIGRIHAYLYTTCARCGERYQVGMIHVPQVIANDYGPPKPIKEVIERYETTQTSLINQLDEKVAECVHKDKVAEALRVANEKALVDKCTIKCPIANIKPSSRKYV